MQISHCVYTEVSQESVVWAGAAGIGDGAEGIGEAEGKRGHRRALDGRSRAHAGVDTTEVFGGAGDGFCEGQKRHSRGPGVCWRKEKFYWAALLGAGYWVSTVGKNEAAVRRYIQEQEKEDQRLDQMTLMPL